MRRSPCGLEKLLRKHFVPFSQFMLSFPERLYLRINITVNTQWQPPIFMYEFTHWVWQEVSYKFTLVLSWNEVSQNTEDSHFKRDNVMKRRMQDNNDFTLETGNSQLLLVRVKRCWFWFHYKRLQFDDRIRNSWWWIIEVQTISRQSTGRRTRSPWV